MISTLKFVQGAVSRKDFVPALTHFYIEGGRITGYNGRLSLSSPIALDVDCCPKAEPFVKAIQACTDTVELHLTPSRKLAIRSGKFRAHVETLEGSEFPGVLPEGAPVAIDGGLLPALARLYEFTAEDASRPWAAGVLLDGDSAYATNNVALIEQWLGYHFPFRVNLPRYAIKEMLRIAEEPVGMQLTANSATFHYEGARWLRTQLNSLDWPDVAGLLNTVAPRPDAALIPEGLFEALATLAPFVNDLNYVLFAPGYVMTATTDGASVELAQAPGEGIYNINMLRLLEGVADRADFTQYPSPVPFYGDKLRGALVGIRL